MKKNCEIHYILATSITVWHIQFEMLYLLIISDQSVNEIFHFYYNAPLFCYRCLQGISSSCMTIDSIVRIIVGIVKTVLKCTRGKCYATQGLLQTSYKYIWYIYQCKAKCPINHVCIIVNLLYYRVKFHIIREMMSLPHRLSVVKFVIKISRYL